MADRAGQTPGRDGHPSSGHGLLWPPLSAAPPGFPTFWLFSEFCGFLMPTRTPRMSPCRGDPLLLSPTDALIPPSPIAPLRSLPPPPISSSILPPTAELGVEGAWLSSPPEGNQGHPPLATDPWLAQGLTQSIFKASPRAGRGLTPPANTVYHALGIDFFFFPFRTE